MKAFLQVQKPKFRGTLWENARRFKLLGAGYGSMPKEQNGYFDIKSVPHLRGVMRALLDPFVRIVWVVGATQVMKSLVGDLWVIYLIEHDSDSVLALFEDDPKAKDFVTTRCLPTARGHGAIAEKIERAVQDTDRHQITTTEWRLPVGRKIKFCGLNDGNVSSLSWRFIWVSEAWQAKPGMLRKAIRRADRYPDTCKIFIESQACMEADDLCQESKAAVRVPLTWECPFCGGRQSWQCDSEYGVARLEGFEARRPRLREGELDLWTPPRAGTFAGMKFAQEERMVAGKKEYLSLEERAESAWWECYYCGGAIKDTPENRWALAGTYEQDYTLPPEAEGLPRRIPREVLFVLPREANPTNTFASGAASYLKAKLAQASGNTVPLENWYMSERAVFYGLALTQRVFPLAQASNLEPEKMLPGEAYRFLMVDVQKDKVQSAVAGEDVAGHFWWVAESVDRAGNVTMLLRGYATSWEELFGPGGVKERLGIPTRNVAIDASYQTESLKKKAAEYRTLEKSLVSSGKAFATWRLMCGDDARSFQWNDGKWRSYSMPRQEEVDVLAPDGRWIKVMVNVTRWGNFPVKSVLAELREQAPGQPKFMVCPDSLLDAKTLAMEKGDRTYENQLKGFKLGTNKKGRPEWLELHKEQHYVDCHCMGIVFRMEAGMVRGEAEASAVV